MFAQESVMEIQKEQEAFEAWFESRYDAHFMQFALDLDMYIDKHTQTCWEAWQAAKAQAVPEGRTDFEIINQTIELVDLLALSTNVFQRDPKSKVHPFESENPRVMEWWRTACQIQELLTNTDPDNCDFEEYKAMIEALEPAND